LLFGSYKKNKKAYPFFLIKEVYTNMPKPKNPIFPKELTYINKVFSTREINGEVCYYNFTSLAFSHKIDDLASFYMYCSKLYMQGSATQSELRKVFGISKNKLKRSVNNLNTKGIGAFFCPPKIIKKRNLVMTEDVIKKAQQLLNEGKDKNYISRTLNIKKNTLEKAIRDKRLNLPSKQDITTKSQRSQEDIKATLGVGATNIIGRTIASIGGGEVAPHFEKCLDVPNGGVLTAVPALLACGLLHKIEYLRLPRGYYNLITILLSIAFMILSRIKNIEQLRYYSPGEWGKLLGIDRIPEIKTLREKIFQLKDTYKEWEVELSSLWVLGDTEISGFFYIDGHVKIYTGKQTNLPKHYVARQRLCLRSTSDYWVNGMKGQPYFKINKVVDPGLLKTLEFDIIPDLKRQVSKQQNSRYCFTIVFDREGYSFDFFYRMIEQNIACITYNKFSKEDWLKEEFIKMDVTLASGDTVEMLLLEKRFTKKLKNKKELLIREIRKLTDTGHQLSIITTNDELSATSIASYMFARWSQENYFKYMKEAFNLDSLMTYRTEPISGPVLITNPQFRELESSLKSLCGILNRKKAEFGSIILDGETIDKNETLKGDLQAEINEIQDKIEQLKKIKKETPKHILFNELPESEKFRQLDYKSQHFVDLIKMIAYRAETAMVNILKPEFSHTDNIRSFLANLYQTSVDLLPDYATNTLTVRIHNLSTKSFNGALEKICKELNETETKFPGTTLKMIFEPLNSS